MGALTRAAVIGAGSWGMAVSYMLANKGIDVSMWAKDSELAREAQESRRNPRYLPDLIMPPDVLITADLAAALQDRPVVIIAVPSQAVRAILNEALSVITDGAYIVSLSKGIEEATGLRVSQVIYEELQGIETRVMSGATREGSGHVPESPPFLERLRTLPDGPTADRIAVLSGPNHSEEVCKRIPSATVISSSSKQAAVALQELFMTPYFRVYTNPDIVGVELGGASKNVIAIAAGISDGVGYGDNTKASLMTRGLAEMMRLGKALGADPATFAGLSGIGDLIVTCTSQHSRNRATGALMASGLTLAQATTEIRMVAEGVKTSAALNHIADALAIDMPITKRVYQVLHQGKPCREAVAELLNRGPGDEIPWS